MNKKDLNKESMFGLETLAGVAAGHLAQNVAASRMLNVNGGRRIADSILHRTRGTKKSAIGKFFSGLKTAIVPESGILRDHVAEIAGRVPEMSRGERALMAHLGKGNFKRVFNSPALEKSTHILDEAEKYGVNARSMLEAKKMMPRKVYDKFLRQQEELYKGSPVGKVGRGITEGLQNAKLKQFNNIGKLTKTEAAGEAAGNIAIAPVEWGIPLLNGAKRVFTEGKADVRTTKGKIQKVGDEWAVHPLFRKAKALASQGKGFSKKDKLVNKYLMNPVTYAAADYSNKSQRIARNIARHPFA